MFKIIENDAKIKNPSLFLVISVFQVPYIDEIVLVLMLKMTLFNSVYQLDQDVFYFSWRIKDMGNRLISPI